MTPALSVAAPPVGCHAVEGVGMDIRQAGQKAEDASKKK
jgi:predicted small secreted protein